MLIVYVMNLCYVVSYLRLRTRKNCGRNDNCDYFVIQFSLPLAIKVVHFMENGSSHNTVCMLQQIKEYILI
jgi:hypothetical protein